MSDLFKQASELEGASEGLCRAVGDWCGGARSGDDMARQALDVAKMAQQLSDAIEREVP